MGPVSTGVSEAVEVRHSPARFSSVLAVGAGLLAVVTSGVFTALALVVGLFGLLGVAVGLFAVESRRLTTAGTVIVFVGLLTSGLFADAAPAFLMLSMMLTVLTFDLGQNAFGVGAQLSDATETRRGELVHAAASLGVGVVAVTVAYSIYLLSWASTSVTAVTFVLLAAVALAWSMRS